MCNYSGTVLERGIVQGIVIACKKYHISLEEAVKLVMEELDYDIQDAQEIVRRYYSCKEL